MELTPTLVDAVIVAIVLISAVLAYGRGFVSETLTLGVWILAGLAAFFYHPIVEPTLRELLASVSVDLGEYTRHAAGLVTFVIALIALSVIASAIRAIVRSLGLTIIDKGLGFLFGALRGLVLLALVYLGAAYFAPSQLEYAAFQESRGFEVVRDTAQWIESLEILGRLNSAFSSLFGYETLPASTEVPALDTYAPAAPAQPN